MTYRVRLPIAKTPPGQLRNESIERLEVERANAGGLIVEAVSELPRPVAGQILYFYNVPGYDNGLYYYDGTKWIQLDNTSIDVQSFTIDGTGNVWDDLNVMNFTGQQDAQPDGTVLIDTQILVTFYHNNAAYDWGGPRPVYVGTGGNHTAVESDLIPTGVANLVTSVHGRVGDVVGQAGDYTYDQVGADPAGSAAAVQANLDAHTAYPGNPHQKMNWKGAWAGGQYLKDDVVTDQGWLSIANKTTTERSSVQSIGNPFWILDTAAGWTLNNPQGLFVASGQDYTFGETGYLTGYRAYFPAAASSTISYTFAIQDISVAGEAIDLLITRPEPAAAGWIETIIPPLLVRSGAKLRFALAYEDNANETTISANYDYFSDNNDVVPLTGDAHRRLNRTWVRFHKTDNDGNAGIIDAVPVGATISVSGISDWDVIGKTDGGTYWEFDIIGTGDPLPGVHQFDFTYPTSARPQLYYDIPGYWTANPPASATVQGYLNLDGVITLDDTAYAVDIQIQEAYIPADWDQLAYTGDAGGGGGGGSGEINAGINVGGGTGEIYRDKVNENLAFKTLTSTQASVDITNAADTVDLHVNPYTGANLGTGADVYQGTANNTHSFRRLRSSDGSLDITQFSGDIDMSVVGTSKKIVNGSIRNGNIITVATSGWSEFTQSTGWTTRNMINCTQPVNYRLAINTTGNFYGTVTIMLTAGLYGGATVMSDFGLMINGASPATSAPRLSIDHSLVNQSSSNFIRYPVCIVVPVYNVTSSSQFGIGYSGSDLEDITNAAIVLDLREI